MATPVPVKATSVIRQQNPAGLGFVPVARWVDVVAVSASAATYTVPANVTCLRLTPLSAAGACYGNVNGAAAAPSTGVTNGSGSFPVPAGLMINCHVGDALSLISTSASFIIIEGWS